MHSLATRLMQHLDAQSLRRLAVLVACVVSAWTQAADHAADTDPFNIKASWTQYAGSAVDGPVDEDLRLGGRFDATLLFKGSLVGLSDASSLTLVPECVYGRNVNGLDDAGLLLPVNSALNFPSSDGEDCDLAVSYGYRSESGATWTIGKINTQANSRATPLVGGGGLEGFQHGFLPTPPTFISQRTLLGVLVTLPTKGPSVTLGLWDPLSAVNRSNLSGAFSEGIAGQVVLNFPVKFDGLDGSQKLTLMASTQDGLDFESIPEVNLPPESQQYLTKSGRWHVQYSFHQYLWQDPDDPKHGWGIFGRFGLWDGNPTPFEQLAVIGVIGNPPFVPARRSDRFGLGWFVLTISEDLKQGLQSSTPIAMESGIEAFYTFDINPHLQLSVNAEYLDPGFENIDRILFIGARLYVPF